MSFHRETLLAFATLFTVGMTSLASACCNWGYSAPIAYAAVPVAVAPVTYGGCGGCCGGCGAPTAAAVFAQPVAPAPISVCYWGGGWGGAAWNGSWGGGAWSGWGGGCGGCCGGCGGCCGRGVIGYAAASPLYVVNQGPYYAGPGLMVPYATYSAETAYAPATDYPYAPGYGGGYGPGYGSGYGPGYGYGVPAYRPYARPYYRPRYAYRMPYHPRVY
jgi:hypothetical protein